MMGRGVGRAGDMEGVREENGTERMGTGKGDGDRRWGKRKM